MTDSEQDAAMLAELRACMGDQLRWERSAWGQRLMHEHGARLLALAEEGLRLRCCTVDHCDHAAAFCAAHSDWCGHCRPVVRVYSSD